MTGIIQKAEEVFKDLKSLSLKDKVEAINRIKKKLHEYSPFKNEPVDFVQWIPMEEVEANDYNPNQVAPPEMKLLEHSINSDGYTQPIVAWINDGVYEVVDGFHRNRVGKECESVGKRVKGYLPLTIINKARQKRNDRIAATIRHNRARGKHTIDGMAEIVLELKRRNWTTKKISRELGMDADEVLRLSQITGLAEAFKDEEFSKAWAAVEINETDTLDIKEEVVENEN